MNCLKGTRGDHKPLINQTHITQTYHIDVGALLWGIAEPNLVCKTAGRMIAKEGEETVRSKDNHSKLLPQVSPQQSVRKIVARFRSRGSSVFPANRPRANSTTAGKWVRMEVWKAVVEQLGSKKTQSCSCRWTEGAQRWTKTVRQLTQVSASRAGDCRQVRTGESSCGLWEKRRRRFCELVTRLQIPATARDTSFAEAAAAFFWLLLDTAIWRCSRMISRRMRWTSRLMSCGQLRGSCAKLPRLATILTWFVKRELPAACSQWDW